MADPQKYYRVRQGDTMGNIAKCNHTTVAQLAKINGIKDVNRINVGQLLALKADAALKVEIQMLDRDRNPIANAKLRIEHNGVVLDRTSGKDGRVTDIITETPDDIIKIWIQRADESWKQITQATTDWGNKLITLVSPKIKIDTKTQSHPQDEHGHPVAEAPKTAVSNSKWQVPMLKASTAKGDPQSLFSSVVEKFGIKSAPSTDANGVPSLRITNDQSGLDFLDTFNGELLTDTDFTWAASELGVEAAVIRAINDVEAAGKGFETLYERMVPKILYERQWFHRNTNGVYSPDNQDISCPTGYYQKKARFVPATQVITDATGKLRTISYWRRYNQKKDISQLKESRTGKQLFEEGLATKENDQYLSSIGSYKRLVKAYKLDKEAALKSCSWGGFQIMGFHYKSMGYVTVEDFVKSMSRSEREQMIALVKFFKKVSPGLVPAMKNKDFTKLAVGFNGSSYKENDYDTKLLSSYNKWKIK